MNQKTTTKITLRKISQTHSSESIYIAEQTEPIYGDENDGEDRGINAGPFPGDENVLCFVLNND